MGLVNYDSSDSEAEGQTQSQFSLKSDKIIAKEPKNHGVRKITVNAPIKKYTETTVGTATDSSGGFDLESLLPAPKNEQLERSNLPNAPRTESIIAAPLSRKTRTLGGGIKSQFEGEIKVIDHYTTGLPGIDSNKPRSRKIVPASQLAREVKYGTQATVQSVAVHHTIGEEIAKPTKQAAVQLPDLFSYHTTDQQKTDSKFGPTFSHGQTSVATHLAPLPGYNNESEDEKDDRQQTLVVDEGFSGKNKRKHVEIMDFNVDEFYEDNQRNMVTSQPPATQTKVHQIASGRHQLSSLISSAQQNQDALSEMYQENKRKRAEARKKYGF